MAADSWRGPRTPLFSRLLGRLEGWGLFVGGGRGGCVGYPETGPREPTLSSARCSRARLLRRDRRSRLWRLLRTQRVFGGHAHRRSHVRRSVAPSSECRFVMVVGGAILLPAWIHADRGFQDHLPSCPFAPPRPRVSCRRGSVARITGLAAVRREECRQSPDAPIGARRVDCAQRAAARMQLM